MMSSDFSLSIVIAAWNAEATIRDAIESSLPLVEAGLAEVVVVNDGSTDTTREALDFFAGRITIIDQENRGAAKARTVGGVAANGKWLLFLDADDILMETGVREMVEHGDASAADVVYGIVREDKEGKCVERFHEGVAGEAPWPARALFWKNLLVAPGSVIVRKSLFEKVGGFSKDQPSDDRNFWLRCGVFGTFAALRVPVLTKRIQPGSVSFQRGRSIFHQYWYLLDFLDWCESRWVDSSIFKTSKEEILERGLCHALEEKNHSSFSALLHMARIEVPGSSLVKTLWPRRVLAFWFPGFLRRTRGLPAEAVAFGKKLPQRDE